MPCHITHLPAVTIHDPESPMNDGVQVTTHPMSKCNQMSIPALQPMSLCPCSSHLHHPPLNLQYLSIQYLSQSQDQTSPPIATCITSSTRTHERAVVAWGYPQQLVTACSPTTRSYNGVYTNYNSTMTLRSQHRCSSTNDEQDYLDDGEQDRSSVGISLQSTGMSSPILTETLAKA